MKVIVVIVVENGLSGPISNPVRGYLLNRNITTQYEVFPQSKRIVNIINSLVLKTNEIASQFEMFTTFKYYRIFQNS